MKLDLIAKVAVWGVPYQVDKPYSYNVGNVLSDTIAIGKRVAVPFGSSRLKEGIVLHLEAGDSTGLKSIISVLDENPILSDKQIKLALWMRERYFCTLSDCVKCMIPTGLWYKLSESYKLSDSFNDTLPLSDYERILVESIKNRSSACPLSDLEDLIPKSYFTKTISSLIQNGILIPIPGKITRVSDKIIKKVSLAVSKEEAKRLIASNKRAVRQNSILSVLCDLESAGVSDLCYFTGCGRDTIRRLEEKKLVTISNVIVSRRPGLTVNEELPLPLLNSEQMNVYNGIAAKLSQNKFSVSLLYGVTGSGKTMVYIHLIKKIIETGKTAILLVPEISLTPQMLKTFSSYFGDSIAILHSALTLGERYDEWKRICCGDAKLVIGTRSAIFAPLSNLGIIILDEEQDSSYKSENTPRYNAREVAQYLASLHSCEVVLGSATPDITSYYYAQNTRYSFFEMKSRFNQLQLPMVKIADMRQEIIKTSDSCISSLLREEIQKNIENDEQTILFLNRRGNSRLVTCIQCGFTYDCPNCSNPLTFHKGNKLICHYCGHTQPIGNKCPDCGGNFKFIGFGTQKVVEELESLFPNQEILRIDTDALSSAENHATLLERFRSQNIPIMVGTQMVSKGLNFENVTLVGVLLADQGLYSGNWRATESSFSLITQVIGRSGRFNKLGRAVIQTFTPDNYVISSASKQDYLSFYNKEIEFRELADMPPFSDIFTITAVGKKEDRVINCCNDIRRMFINSTKMFTNIKILGPAPLPVVKINNQFRYRITIIAKDSPDLHRIVSGVLNACYQNKTYSSINVYADINSLNG